MLKNNDLEHIVLSFMYELKKQLRKRTDGMFPSMRRLNPRGVVILLYSIIPYGMVYYGMVSVGLYFANLIAAQEVVAPVMDRIVNVHGVIGV